jgi:valyl-tRNA synthetase
MATLSKTYDPTTIEKNWSQFWERTGQHQASGHGQPYSIVLPPPNVTGSLHMGHGFQQTLMDTLIRYHRMCGDNTHWQVGTDHAGIATQMVVERQLAASNVSRHDLGRDAFVEKVWEWKEQSGSRIGEQIRQLGASADWQRERFSMDPGLCDAVNTVFLRLHDEGLIYRGKRLVNWDPKFHTAISDLEVINKEQQGHMWHIRYPISDGSGHIVVATTRPETLLGDSAVAVHPDDERYQSLIGKTVDLPLCERQIPIIADDYVDPEFGSGCVKITPAHDFNDYAVGSRHNLPLINIMTIDAHISDEAPEAYRGLERFAARKQIIKDLETVGLVEKIEPHSLQVPYGDRSDVVIEPLLTDQWFVKATALAGPAIEALKTQQLKFIPENWGKTYLQWLENIEDWCISRQLWWGHRIPAWYDEAGNYYVGQDEASIREKHQLADTIALKQDDDVLDTWFSAALWPFATLGWPEKTPELDTFYPTSVLVTGFDIIFFWVARMVMMGIHFLGKPPFKEVYITGLIRDGQGQKMSKSKGNVLDPLDVIHGIDLPSLIEKRTRSMMQPKLADKIAKDTRKEFPDGIAAYGTDALRFTYCALASTGRNINFDLGRVEGYRNFCNKIWNAARFTLMQVADQQLQKPQPQLLSLADRWILHRLQQTISEAHRHIKGYRFDLLAQCLYEFIWNEYCDWYLELIKVTLYNDATAPEQKAATYHTLAYVLEQSLRLIHPLMPFISEEIWQSLKAPLGLNGESIMQQSYPIANEQLVDSATEQLLEQLRATISAIRNVRGEMNVAPGKSIEVLFESHAADSKTQLETLTPYIQQLAKVSQLNEVSGATPAAATAVAGPVTLHIPLAGLVDVEAELARLEKTVNKLTAAKTQCEKKLSNPSYTDKAPAAVVQKERDKLEQLNHELSQLQSQREQLLALSE